MKFNEFLRKKREISKLTQADASSSIGVSVATIQNWERGDNKPEINAIPYIAKTYNLEIEDVLRRFAADLNIIDYKEESVNVIRYKDVLPTNYSLDVIEELYFTEKEQELFLIFALNLECGGNPIPQMSNECVNNLELALFLDKMKKYKIYIKENASLTVDNYYGSGHITSNTIKLTNVGDYIYDKIKKTQGKLFNVYNLELMDLLEVLELYKSIENKNYKSKIPLKNMAIVIQELVSEEYILDGYQKGCYSSHYTEYEKVDIKSSKLKDSRKKCIDLIDSSYYEIKEVEWENEEYKMDKEIYFKKLDFYNKNKDLIDDLTIPRKYREKTVLKAIPTEKAKLFVEFLNSDN